MNGELSPDWRVAPHTFTRAGDWAHALRAETDDTTVRLYDQANRLVLIIGVTPVDAFKHIGSPKRLLLDPNVD
jgi:hypothetical protein